ncbi:KDEL motif-containing protein 1 [Gracilariopsis chorda]|uniref:KDEL motif-containing protein 1 n=1 Tax=Gracilariopsis chorda TaxID=448386 RepID=A0A2V3IKQ1_9FLOR|nr:KDEL motif-containing protein 1 [Gracilariopsis chorda]|eukprot:PXF42651.1 KDEL motif-containing protein 1 [Gracilariopsis chorda]
MGNAQTRSRSLNAYELRELATSWSAAAESCVISLRRRCRRLPLLSLILLVTLAITLYAFSLHPGFTHFSIANVATRISHTTSPCTNNRRPAAFQLHAIPFRSAIRTLVQANSKPLNSTHASSASFPPISITPSLKLVTSTVRSRYARLARAYLSPFAALGKISSESYMRPFLRDDGRCGGCVLLQVTNRSMFLHDRRGVLTKMAPFRALRLREALHWVESSVSRGVVDNFEIIISTTDSVATTSRNHSYRMPDPEEASPIFGTVACNVSNNIPFPLVLSDVLRRGLPHKFWDTRSEMIDQWDQAMRSFGEEHAYSVPWHRKKAMAVFRGRIRISTFLKRREMFDDFCDKVGRTALWATARKHNARMKRWAVQKAKNGRIWPLPTNWFLPRVEQLLDVQVDGTCGKRIYVSDGMPLQKQAEYKYIMNVEGNSFWADRLLLLLFGSSAVMKQETPCGMFFEPLLEANVHYIPVDYWFRDLTKRTQWARRHDCDVMQIVRNARRFAGEYLSTAGIQTYVDELLKQYSELLEERRIKVRPGSVQVYP